jgi:hypothetical protein
MKALKHLPIALVFLAAGCASKQSSKIHVDSNKIKYDIDTRTGFCYAYMGSTVDDLTSNTKYIQFTLVPATSDVLKQIKPEKLEELRKNGITPYNWLEAPARPTQDHTPNP